MTEITEQIVLGDLFQLAPDSVVILNNEKLDCTGCSAPTSLTLREIFLARKVNEQDQERILRNLNKLKQTAEIMKEPKPEDFEVIVKEEKGAKVYHLAGLKFTANAYKNLHQLATEKGLSIKLETGGCSGFKYQFDYVADPDSEQKSYTISDKLKIFLDDFTFDKSYGSTVDFPISLHSSGLQIHNPKQKRACSCGTSFGF
jgi:iron-sulfur cluster assembly accessory protein